METNERVGKDRCHAFKHLDLFGEHISLTFKQRSTFQTRLGATVSLFCITLMTTFFIVRT